MDAWAKVSGATTAYLDSTGVHVPGVSGVQIPLTLPTGSTAREPPWPPTAVSSPPGPVGPSRPRRPCPWAATSPRRRSPAPMPPPPSRRPRATPRRRSAGPARQQWRSPGQRATYITVIPAARHDRPVLRRAPGDQPIVDRADQRDAVHLHGPCAEHAHPERATDRDGQRDAGLHAPTAPTGVTAILLSPTCPSSKSIGAAFKHPRSVPSEDRRVHRDAFREEPRGEVVGVLPRCTRCGCRCVQIHGQ